MPTKQPHTVGGKIFVLHTIYSDKQQALKLRELMTRNSIHVRVKHTHLGHEVWVSREDWLEKRDKPGTGIYTRGGQRKSRRK